MAKVRGKELLIAVGFSCDSFFLHIPNDFK